MALEEQHGVSWGAGGRGPDPAAMGAVGAGGRWQVRGCPPMPGSGAQRGGAGGGGAALAGGRRREVPKAEVPPRGVLVAAGTGPGGRGGWRGT